MASDQIKSGDEKLRGSIASKVLVYGTVVLGILAAIIIGTGIVLIYNAGNDDTKIDKAVNLLTNVFYSLLPVVATWVGTVIAFYFGKANFEAANQSAKDFFSAITSEQKLRGIKVSDKEVMINFTEIKYFNHTSDEEVGKTKVSTLIKFMIDKKVTRLPFITPERAIKYCIHRSVFDKFISSLALNKPDVNIKEQVFNDFLATDIDEIKNYISSGIIYANEDATLFDIKQMMDNNKYCEDAFVTKTGSKSEPVIGWVTNDAILEKSKI